MNTLGSHSATLLGSQTTRPRGGNFSGMAAMIGGATQTVRERSPFKTASAVVGTVASGARDVRAPYEPGRGQSR